MGEYLVQSVFLTGFPQRINVGWLDPFLSHEGDLDLSVHVLPLSNREAIKALTEARARLQAEMRLQGGSIALVDELRVADADLDALRERIRDGHSRLCHVACGANLYARSREELEDRAAGLASDLASRSLHNRVPEGRNDEAFLTVAPIGLPALGDVRYWHTFDTVALSTCFPFVAADIYHPGGVPLGVNLSTGLLVFLNAFHVRSDGRPGLPNKNMIVYASSGSGKTTFARVYAGRAAALGERWVILDPEGVYRMLVERLGGIYFRVGDPKFRFNPGEVEVDEDPDDGTPVIDLRGKRQDLLQLIGAMLGGLSAAEEYILDEAIAEEYAARGITEDPESIWVREGGVDEQGMIRHGRRKKPMPRLSDFHRRLISKCDRLPEGSQLVEGLRLYLEGGALDFFDYESNLDLSDPEARIIVFDLSRLEEGRARPLGMHVVLSWVWEKFVKKNPEHKKRVVVDEAQMFADHQDSMKFLETMARRCRKRNAGLMVISQDYHKFHQNLTTRAIHQNTCLYLFLKQTAADIGPLAETFRLSQGEQDFLLSAETGRGILRIDHGGHQEMAALEIIPLEVERGWVFQEPGQEQR